MPAPQTQSDAAVRTYSLPEIAEILCGAAGRANEYWVSQRLRGAARPQLPGFKVQRRWRMTQADLDAAIELLRPRPSVPAVPAMTSLTARSARRLDVVDMDSPTPIRGGSRKGPRAAATAGAHTHH